MPASLRPGHGLILIDVALLAFGVEMVNYAGLTFDADRAMMGANTFVVIALALLATFVGFLIGNATPQRRPIERPVQQRLPRGHAGRGFAALF